MSPRRFPPPALSGGLTDCLQDRERSKPGRRLSKPLKRQQGAQTHARCAHGNQRAAGHAGEAARGRAAVRAPLSRAHYQISKPPVWRRPVLCGASVREDIRRACKSTPLQQRSLPRQNRSPGQQRDVRRGRVIWLDRWKPRAECSIGAVPRSAYVRWQRPVIGMGGCASRRSTTRERPRRLP